MKKIYIPVGHGGNDPGAVANGYKEADMNLVTALAMKKELEVNYRGVEVKLSREKNENDAVGDEVKKGKAYAPHIVVSIHNNSGGGDGFEVFYQTNRHKVSSMRLARLMEEEVKKIGQNSRGLKTRSGEGGKDFYGVLREIDAVSVLCEGCFLDNKTDIAIADTEEEQKAFGKAYAMAIARYIGLEKQQKPTSIKVGDKVKYSGKLYKDSYGSAIGSTVNGTYTVSKIVEGRMCEILLDNGLGWVKQEDCKK
ncbi:MAG: N-acetylmuramoyl-L-alanine amidase [Bacteroidaceae bacterium]